MSWVSNFSIENAKKHPNRGISKLFRNLSQELKRKVWARSIDSEGSIVRMFKWPNDDYDIRREENKRKNIREHT